MDPQPLLQPHASEQQGQERGRQVRFNGSDDPEKGRRFGERERSDSRDGEVSFRSAMDLENNKLIVEPEEPKVSFFHHSRLAYRGFVLFLQCMLTFGSFYCYDIPGALKADFFHSFPSLTQLEYNLMYSLYSWPNTVQVFFGGYIIDRYVGVQWGCVICTLLLLTGQIMVAIGVQAESVAMQDVIHSIRDPFTFENDLSLLPLVLAGRFVFGMGGETLCVAQSAYVAKWFKGAELATAFGICLSFSRLGSAVNFDISPWVVKFEGPWGGLLGAEYVGVATVLLQLLCCFVLNALDSHADRKKEEEENKSCGESDASGGSSDEEVSLSDIWTFGADVWIIFLICVSFYASVFVFLQNGVQFLRQRYDLTNQQAAFLMSMPYSISALACPVFGYLVDKTGRALVWVFMSTSMLGFVHFSFAYWDAFPPWAGVAVIGMAYSICAAALWPCIAIVVELHKLGTAYGLMTAFQNLGLAVFPLVISDLLPEDDADYTKEKFQELYGPVMSVFASTGAAGASLTLILFFVDMRTGGWLNASAEMLLEREDREEEEELEAMEKAEEADTPLLPPVHLHVTHQRQRYLSKLGIRPGVSIHGGPRPFTNTGHMHPPHILRHNSSPAQLQHNPPKRLGSG